MRKEKWEQKRFLSFSWEETILLCMGGNDPLEREIMMAYEKEEWIAWVNRREWIWSHE